MPKSLQLALVAIALAPLAMCAAAPSTEQFERQVRPVLLERCVSCHGPRLQQGGLRLDRPDFLAKGADGGPVVKPGDPDASRLIQAVRHHGALKMPPDRPLPPAQVAALEEWVRAGARWPGPTKPVAVGRDRAATHWAFQPVRTPPVPKVRDRGWVRSPIDAFVLAELERRGMRPAPPADRRTLIRRVTYDLIGLPPSVDDIRAFEADRSPDAYEKVVDRLLADPRYGERWGRHWLDVARYADTRGYVRLQEERLFPYAYTYRDWVVRSLNEDLPYDRFVLEQLAADQLPDEGGDLAALGFLTLGRRFTGNRHDIIDDRIDVVARGLQGLTVACARCHDHKYDPIPTADYYSLYGVFASSDDPEFPPLIGSPDAAARAHVEEFERRRRASDERESRAYEALLNEFRARSGDYLVRALAGRQPPQQPLPHAPGEIRQFVVERWIDALQDAGEARDPVFAPWHAFAGLPAERFPAEATALVARWRASGPDPKLNDEVRAHFVAHPPASMQDVARGYGELFQGVHARIESRRIEARDRAAGVRNGSFEADGPTVNRQLFGWRVTGARVVTLATEGSSDGQYAVVFGDGLPASNPPTGHTGQLAQAVPTEPGAEYRLTFTYGAFGSGAPEHEQALRAEVRGRTVLARRLVTARGSVPSVLKPVELVFRADGPGVTLVFADATSNGESGRADGVLDDVRLTLLRTASGAPPPPQPPADDPVVLENAVSRALVDVLYGPGSPVVVTRNQAIDHYLYDAPINAELVRLRNLAGGWLAQTAEAPPRAHTLEELAPSRDARILIRGNPQRPGPRVPRQNLAVLSGADRRPFDPHHARLDLARAIVDPRNPLTARVIVNRVWGWHFGQGLVRTPSDFGARGEPPTHPALLDWLAATFAAPATSSRPPLHTSQQRGLGYRLKSLHRLILLSSTYRQSSRAPVPDRDPDNRWLGRMNRTRLDVEEFRDSVLLVAGRLDPRMGGPGSDLLSPDNRRRTLYATIDRQALPGMLRLFDFASPDTHTPVRHATTVPLQGLFLLNSPFMQDSARAAADGATRARPPREQVEALYRRVLARDPTPVQLSRGLVFLAEGTLAELAQALLLSNEFAFID